MRRGFLLTGILVAACFGQAPPTGPVVSPRGIINAFTVQPAPSVVAAGGIIWINGLNLGPPDGIKATGSPLPTRLADPSIEVIINGRAAPLYSATPGRIVAQVPLETPPGIAEVVVKRGDLQSRSARLIINQVVPALRTKDDLGYGEAAGAMSGRSLTLAATGLGITEPRVSTGEVGPQDPPATPRNAVRAYVGGLPAVATARLSSERVGEFDITVEVPPESQPGDIIALLLGNQEANRATFNRITSPDVQFLRLPQGTPELRRLASSDLRGNYLVANGARASDGCYPSYLFDFGRSRAARLESCLVAGNQNAISPIATFNNNHVLASFVGPALGEPGRTSAKVQIFNPARGEPVNVELPSPAAQLQPNPDGNIIALIPGDPPSRFLIDVQSGQVREAPASGPAQPGPAPGLPRDPGQQPLAGLELDLGDGIRHILSIPSPFGPGQLAVVVGNDENKPTKAKLAVLNQRGEFQAARDFPEPWLPLVPPQPARPGGGMQPRPGDPGPGGGAAVNFRVSVTFDALTRTLFVLSQNADGSAHGFSTFAADGADAKVATLPEGWFVAGCTANIRGFNLELSRRVAYFGARAADSEFRNICPSHGFLLLEPSTASITAVPLPAQGQLNASANLGDVNDYLYGTNSDPTNPQVVDTLYVLDGVSGSAFSLSLPTGITSFAGVTPVPLLGALVATARTRTPGDGGLIWFDLENETSRILPVPSGFASIQLVAVYETTRKVIARGIRPDNAGSQYLIFDLITGDLVMAPNPEGVVFVGALPAQQAPGGGGGGGQQPQQPQQPAQLQVVNEKSNFLAGVAFNEQRRQVGVVAVRVH